MTNLPEDHRRKEEIERLSRLPQFPRFPPPDEKGVLLSDRIKYYCEKYELVSPYHQDQFRPASYALRVGRRSSIDGRLQPLDDGAPLEILPYQVAIIETYETINLPRYMIGRWNVQTKKAYSGLLWVGGAQVDPGFRGHLCCPIYNLSTQKVTLNFRENIAVIDFVTTTPYEDGKCIPFDWADRKMLLFSDYPFLSSGIEARVKEFDHRIEANEKKVHGELQSATKETADELTRASNRSEESFRGIQARIDTFLTLTFTVVAVLFAAMGIIATKGSIEPSLLNPPVFVAAIALFFALRSYVDVKGSSQRGRWYIRLVPLVLAVMITGLIVLGSLYLHGYQDFSAREIQQAKDQAAKAGNALDQEKKEREAQHHAFEARLQTLQEQISVLKQSMKK